MLRNTNHDGVNIFRRNLSAKFEALLFTVNFSEWSLGLKCNYQISNALKSLDHIPDVI